jgi:hypothetical protein
MVVRMPLSEVEKEANTHQSPRDQKLCCEGLTKYGYR